LGKEGETKPYLLLPKFLAKIVDFGASDVAMTDVERFFGRIAQLRQSCVSSYCLLCLGLKIE